MMPAWGTWLRAGSASEKVEKSSHMSSSLWPEFLTIAHGKDFFLGHWLASLRILWDGTEKNSLFHPIVVRFLRVPVVPELL